MIYVEVGNGRRSFIDKKRVYWHFLRYIPRKSTPTVYVIKVDVPFCTFHSSTANDFFSGYETVGKVLDWFYLYAEKNLLLCSEWSLSVKTRVWLQVELTSNASCLHYILQSLRTLYWLGAAEFLRLPGYFSQKKPSKEWVKNLMSRWAG